MSGKNKKKLDDDLEAEIKDLINREFTSVKSSLKQELSSAGRSMAEKRKVAEEKLEDYEELLAENPVEWIAGAFLAGILIGKILK